MAPSISIRDSIRWLPSPANEATRTLVLTSPENRFIDIRILRAKDRNEICEGIEDFLPLSRLDWAFAGTSSSTPAPSSSDQGQTTHSTWHHWIDSRHRDAETVRDEGDMFALADGRTLEKGRMVNPETGEMGEYEEVWRGVEILAADSEQTGGTGRGTCTVMTLHDERREARGMVIRLGQFCQGVLRIGERFSLERWLWGQGEGWRRDARMGEFLVPCGVATSGKVPRVGGKVEYGEFVWEVVESGEV